MTLNQLLTFAAIARDLNLSHASAKVNVSQSSITQQMRKLENEFKTKLYRKSHRGIVLTEDGETFLRYVQAILRDVQNLTKRFERKSSTKHAATLRVGGSFAPSASFLPRVLAAFQRKHPETRLELKTHDSVTLERMLLASQLDVALLNHRPKSANLVSQAYRREKLVAFAPANHPLAKKRQLTLRELARAPLIIREAKGT
jgi:DNA-binding transcriptional LysR family regulator